MGESALVRAVDAIIGKGGVTRLERAGSARTGMPENASVINAPRLLLALRGTARFETAHSEGGVRRLTLSPGDGLYVPALHWVKSAPTRVYQTLGLIFYPEQTRVYTMEAVRENKVWRMRMRAADECAALGSRLAGAVFPLLEKPSDDPVTALRERAAANVLLAEGARLLQRNEAWAKKGKAWQHWQAARHYVDSHVQEPLDRQQVAAILRMHPNHLSRLFKSFSESSYNRYVMQARMARAELLLADASLNVSEVAYLCGFSSPGYFIRLYHRAYGCPPGKRRLTGAGV